MIIFAITVIGLIFFLIGIVALCIVGAIKDCEQDEDWIVYPKERGKHV